jgi:tetratricopeptide (TPR) repeat protein
LGRHSEAEIRLQQASGQLGRLNNVFHRANALAVLCELYYEQRQFEKLYETADVAKSIDNGLIDYHLAQISLSVGQARFDQGEYAQALEVLCEASRRALSFNNLTFYEVQKDIMKEVDRILQLHSPRVALLLCDTFQKFWEGQELDSSQQSVVQESLQGFREKQEELKALGPLSE